MIYIEIKQMQREGKEYLTHPLNWLDLFQFIGNIFIISVTMIDCDWPSHSFMRVLSSWIVLVIWMKMFDWFRIFDATSFYIKLLIMTLQDILPFFLIFPIFLMTFGSALLILSSNRSKADMLIEDYVDNWIFNALINQYLLSLGEFNIDNFSDGPQEVMCYLIFFFATFLTQVTALNMIIAIMSDTFSKLSQTQSQHKRQT